MPVSLISLLLLRCFPVSLVSTYLQPPISLPLLLLFCISCTHSTWKIKVKSSKEMDLIHSFLNLVAPPFTFFSLCFILPPYFLLKTFTSAVSYVFSENVSGKVILITGASSGIGEHLAYEYGSRGAYLALVARREKGLREVVDLALELGSPQVIMIIGDVQNVDDCRRIVNETISHFGRLDHLVNNAGIGSVCFFEDATNVTNFRTIMDTNFWGSAYITKFAIPYLRQTAGKIIALSSSGSWLPEPRMTIYNASKAAMVAFFETLRVELSPDIGVLIVTPGYIESELTQGKFMTADGRMDVDQDLRDEKFGPIPVASVVSTARAIVNSACRGDKYLTVPAWVRTTWLWKIFCPDAVELGYRLFFTSDSPGEAAPSKKMLDMTGAQGLMYPASIRNPDIKTA
ncbi:11-beta-hydroxysteroid dehydrogenase 1B [Linum grandiflorum]